MNIYVPLISALLGTLVGAAASIVTVLVQAHYQSKRERTKEAIAIALKDWQTRLEIVTQKGGSALPLSVFIHYHTKLIELAEKGAITPAAIAELHEEQERLIAAVKEMNRGESKPKA